MKKVLSIVALVAAGMFLATSCSNKCKCCSEGQCPCEQMGDKFPGKPGCPGKPGEGGPQGGPCEFGQRPDGPHGPQEGRPGCPGRPGGRHHQMNPEMEEKIGKWMNFDSLSADEQKALIAERKAAIDSLEAERKAKKAEMEEKWANFDKLSIEEQKQLLDQKNHMPFHKKGMHHGRPGGPRGDKK